VINEKLEQSPTRIDKLEEIINKLGSAFSSDKNIDKTPPNKKCKYMYVPKTKGVTPNKENEDLKMINIHPNFVDVIKEPVYRNKKI